MRRAVAMLDDVVYPLIRDGRALGTDRGDVLSMLVLARDEDDGSQLADREVRDEVMTLLLAGHETTANALTWTWYELGRHPEALARLEACWRRRWPPSRWSRCGRAAGCRRSSSAADAARTSDHLLIAANCSFLRPVVCTVFENSCE
jgi:cytochrome P450